jgi:hypothetical protein
MDLTRQSGALQLAADSYALQFAADRPFVYLCDSAGNRLAELFVPSSVHAEHARDDTVSLGEWQAAEAPGQVVFTLQARSSIWNAKTYRLRCQPTRFDYEVSVEGEGSLGQVEYLGGYYSGHIRWGSGFFWSGQQFQRSFTPEPNTDEAAYFAPAEGAVIDLGGVPLPGRGDWFFTPPPYCFGFETRTGWLAAGVRGRPGHNNYTELRYHGRRGSFYLSLAFDGKTKVDGVYELPAITFDFAADEYGALAAHVQALQTAGAAPPPAPRSAPVWWREPIVCGWGVQCFAASRDGGRAPDYSRQALYEDFLATLSARGICPGIVVLDDKWQATYGENHADEEKWPNLRGFVQRQHEAGRKVLLWLKAWDPEGIPAKECITNAIGLPIAVDPGNGAFEERLRAAVRHMLSPDGYDADGFKLDFTARIPSGPGLRSAGTPWGLELMKRYLGILYSESKSAKAEALMMTHTPHPYLADVLDMVRLNDINTGRNVATAMQHRARVAAIACPGAIIDTDNWPITNRAAWREYAAMQPGLGVPSLYYATHIDTTGEALEDQDYALLRETWARYRGQANLSLP